MHCMRTLFVALCALTITQTANSGTAAAQPADHHPGKHSRAESPHKAAPHHPGKPRQHASQKVRTPPIAVERREHGEPVIVHEGEASFYGSDFHGKKTASGEPFDQNKPTAASTELPLGTKATVTNQENGKQVEVIVNDRGPYVDGRVIDLSKKAAKQLDMTDNGVAPVRVEAKPSEQPSEAVKEKVEAKAQEADKGQRDKGQGNKSQGDRTQTAAKPDDTQTAERLEGSTGGEPESGTSGSGQ